MDGGDEIALVDVPCTRSGCRSLSFLWGLGSGGNTAGLGFLFVSPSFGTEQLDRHGRSKHSDGTRDFGCKTSGRGPGE